MSFTAEQKSQLAKLLATENLTVEHQKIATAKFDVKNRVLYLPIWQNMTGVIYDLLVGHEVGHALYTPAEGWHDVVTNEDKNRNYKNFLNVVEDARIEKKVKRKYPGLNSSFRNAYAELNVRDFFGIRGRDVNEMPFIDRLNLFSKSQWTATWIRFTAQEELLVKEVQGVETWEDVVRITEKIYSYSKDEQHEMMLEQYAADMSEDIDGDYDFEDYDDDGYGDEDDEYSDNKSSKSNSSRGEEVDSEKEESPSKEGGGDKDSVEDEQGKRINHEKMSSPGDKDQFDPSCETDENYRRNEFKLLDEKCKEFVYVNIPKPLLQNIVTPAKKVHELMTKSFNQYVLDKYISADSANKFMHDFKNRNERYISLLAKEFEMRKAAKTFSKSKLCDTGDIDINKLSTYKFDDNIFRKVMMTPKGKNHGLVLLLDRSGSMSKNMSGSIEQILVLSMFCRKVNIPFIVYGYTECSQVRAMDMDISLNDYESHAQFNRDYSYTDKYSSFTTNLGEMRFGNVHLREYLNSQMTNAEFTLALKNMCMLMDAYKENRHSRVPRPDSEQLHNTPLNQALVATAEIMKDFKRKNNLDITSLVIVHDGDSDYMNQYFTEVEKLNRETNKIERVKGVDHFNTNVKNYYLRDKTNKFESKISGNYDDLSKCFYEWFRKVTGSRIFGFFIVEGGRGAARSAIYERYVDENGKGLWDSINLNGRETVEERTKQLMKQFKEEKYLVSKYSGFDNFFLIHGGSELTTDDEDGIEVEGKFSARKLATAFAKYNKKRAVNRVLVSRFIRGIAA